MNDKNDATTCSRRTSLATVHVLHVLCSMCVVHTDTNITTTKTQTYKNITTYYLWYIYIIAIDTR